MENITIDDFGKINIRIGTIVEAEIVPEADKLLKFKVDMGEEVRQILSGVREYYPDPLVLIGKQVPVLLNLPTRTLRGFESQGMILYAVGDGKLLTLEPSHQISNGAVVR